MVFFQAALLAGYAYAHLLSTRCPLRLQAVLQAVLVLLPLAVLPIAFPAARLASLPHESTPIFWLLGALLLTVGLPFFVVATSSPLLQKWFSSLRHAAAGDPYFLYGASNSGSILALLAYPALLEPQLRLAQQTWLWTLGYGAFVILTWCCAVALWRGAGVNGQGSGGGVDAAGFSLTPDPRPLTPYSSLTWPRRLRWLALAFVPSSLLLGVTSYLSTDLAAVPLLWVVPLALYLLTFVLVFSRSMRLPYPILGRWLALAVLLCTIILLSQAEPQPVWVLIVIHLAMFFLAALVCHGALAADRPDPRHLSEFYLWLALGGVLGGLFNALVAPLVFNSIAEYPLAMVLACALRPMPPVEETRKARSQRSGKGSDPSQIRHLGFGSRDFTLPLALGVLTLLLIWAASAFIAEYGDRLQLDRNAYRLAIAVMLGIPAVLCYLLVMRPLRFALGVAAILAAGYFISGPQGRPLLRERNFFGTLKITRDADNKFNQLVHGNTLHGRQYLDPARRHEPLAYFYRTGPIGQVFTVFNAGRHTPRVAVVGLGIGSLAAYATPQQQWTFYEIDPAVDRIANDTHYFTFLEDCRAQKLDIVLGDARLRLRAAPAHEYGLLVIDAFSSDAIPIHLLTREALQLYFDRLADDGFLAFHTSNRYLDLKPVLADLARSLGFVCYVCDDRDLAEQEMKDGKDPSEWMVLARRAADLGSLPANGHWRRLPGQSKSAIWTDDYSNILSVFKWTD
jgi:hypothetical protein